MNIREIGEFGFIEKLRRRFAPLDKSVIKGIGDDVGIFEKDENTAILITADMLIENIHFRLQDISPHDLGYKSLAVNLSDIAAVGGIPKTACVSLAVPDKVSYEFLMDFYEGMESLLGEYSVVLIGGDTNRSLNDFIINVTVTGIIKKDEIIYRKGANPGDAVMTTGFLGDSACGLDIIFGNVTAKDSLSNYFCAAHFKPRPHIPEGRILAGSKCVSAMIDVSDGLASDIAHICEESKTGALIFEKDIPFSEKMKEIASRINKNIIDYALFGGEDYCLLAVVPQDKKGELKSVFREKKMNLFEIGKITEGNIIEIESLTGERKTVSKKGFTHF